MHIDSGSVVSAPLDDRDYYTEHRFFLMLH